VILPAMLALHSLHVSGHMHRSVTPDSFLFDANGAVRLGAFSQVCTSVVNAPTQLIGRLEFAAPEILLCESCNAEGTGSMTYAEKVGLGN